jgi:hypothetical protein
VNITDSYLLPIDQDPEEEECQKGNSILSDGLRRKWNRYGSLVNPGFTPVDDDVVQAGLHLSIHYVEREFCTPKMQTMQQMPTWKRVCASSPSQLVREASCAALRSAPKYND